MQKYVPVVSSTGKPLMPTDNKKADKLIAKGRALRRFNRGIFYIQMVDRKDGYTQDIAVGIDPGSKKEAITVKSNSATYLNIQLDAVTWVKKAMEIRRNMRKGRHYHNSPYRKQRLNKKRIKLLPPSTKARWQWKLRVINILKKLYPIDYIVVEDVKAISIKNAKKWNSMFSPVQRGKNWFYKELSNIALTTTLNGYETYELRNDMGLKKSKNKMSDSFDAHCVDSWILANYIVGGHTSPDNKEMIYITPIQFHRRQLHYLQPRKGGTRPRYGGTMSLGFKRGSWVKHPKYGVCYVGGTYGGKRISLHSIQNGIRITKDAKPEDCRFLTLSSWRLYDCKNQ